MHNWNVIELDQRSARRDMGKRAKRRAQIWGKKRENVTIWNSCLVFTFTAMIVHFYIYSRQIFNNKTPISSCMSTTKKNQQLHRMKMHTNIYFNQKPLYVLLLISLMLPMNLNATSASHEMESGLGTSMLKSPESTDAPPGDEVQLQCELNLPPDRVEFRFRPQNSSDDERDRVINIHKMVRELKRLRIADIERKFFIFC